MVGTASYRSRLCRSAPQPYGNDQTHGADGQSGDEGEIAPMDEDSDEDQDDWAMEADGAEHDQGSVKDKTSEDPPEGSIMMAFTMLADLDLRQEGTEKFAKVQRDCNENTEQSLQTLRERLIILEEEVKELRQNRDKGKDNVGGDRKMARSKRPMQ
ncbi:uncharacterized protein N7446_007926 [Penicillium canescens]|uniref:Uncharacterized protein n=1 Tax=Penicillium canescens TaxID=5083 RepID=A0AAD6IM85_PENCN|nr:uncharacterized protein N7446_007857 [Penicillium canescens]XP_058370317.1 uncharacterized protein N7446_007926 [Penicillium canescens]KAJ6033781.1 hypothetical protein N7444_011552 [Penicillium canescens]KAJ6033852.1 hypothetical protein N7444_011623 [Penicillium canescens]KAJ6056960.1 hypothetical protein N7460_000234 [Penicillium canescens]KAJ6057026.1 hypothetical protein N7460_000300 [Penicillium canescens]KAJ6058274.1 hypothetical protein N7446_007857 [Penicillium canescens]